MAKLVRTQFDVILLCAGKSERMGYPKGLQEIGEQPRILAWLRFLSDQRKKTNLGKIYLVLGYHYEKYILMLTQLRDPSFLAQNQTTLVLNPKPDRGPFSSIQEGIEKIDWTTTSATFVCPIDVDPPSSKTWSKLSQTFQDPLDCVVPRFSGQPGHPVILGRRFALELLRKNVDHPEARLDIQIRKLNSSRYKAIDIKDNKILTNHNFESSQIYQEGTKNSQ